MNPSIVDFFSRCGAGSLSSLDLGSESGLALVLIFFLREAVPVVDVRMVDCRLADAATGFDSSLKGVEEGFEGSIPARLLYSSPPSLAFSMVRLTLFLRTLRVPLISSPSDRFATDFLLVVVLVLIAVDAVWKTIM